MAKGIKVSFPIFHWPVKWLDTDCFQLFYIAEYFYAVGAMFIKISVAVTLLRIATARPLFTWAIWAVIGATAIAALVFVIGIANICMCYAQYREDVADSYTGHPINTLWGESNGKCNLQLNTDVSLFFSAIEILTDFSLSILPAILLWNIQMVSLKEIMRTPCRKVLQSKIFTHFPEDSKNLANTY